MKFRKVLALTITYLVFLLMFVPFHESIHATACTYFNGEVEHISYFLPNPHMICKYNKHTIQGELMTFNIWWEVVSGFVGLFVLSLVIYAVCSADELKAYKLKKAKK